MELKQAYYGKNLDKFSGINRTFMELKHNVKLENLLGYDHVLIEPLS